MDTIKHIDALRKCDPDFARLEGHAFESVVDVFDKLCQDMISVLMQYVVYSLKLKCSGYRKER